MKATYVKTPSCQSCFDLGWYTAEACSYCKVERTHTVEVLQLGTGFLGNKAIVKDVDTGQLDTVYISELAIIEEETNEP